MSEARVYYWLNIAHTLSWLAEGLRLGVCQAIICSFVQISEAILGEVLPGSAEVRTC